MRCARGCAKRNHAEDGLFVAACHQHSRDCLCAVSGHFTNHIALAVWSTYQWHRLRSLQLHRIGFAFRAKVRLSGPPLIRRQNAIVETMQHRARYTQCTTHSSEFQSILPPKNGGQFLRRSIARKNTYAKFKYQSTLAAGSSSLIADCVLR